MLAKFKFGSILKSHIILYIYKYNTPIILNLIINLSALIEWVNVETWRIIKFTYSCTLYGYHYCKKGIFFTNKF